jgi:hypothetical protein
MLNACWKLDLLQCNRADGACSDPQKKLLASLKLVTGVILFEKGNNFFLEFWEENKNGTPSFSLLQYNISGANQSLRTIMRYTLKFPNFRM